MNEGERHQRLIVVALVALAIALLGNLGTYLVARDVREVTENTNKVVVVQVPSLERQLKQEKEENEDLNYVLTEQAVPAILAMAEQIEQLGGNAPLVKLDPGSPPFEEQQKNGG